MRKTALAICHVMNSNSFSNQEDPLKTTSSMLVVYLLNNKKSLCGILSQIRKSSYADFSDVAISL